MGLMSQLINSLLIKLLHNKVIMIKSIATTKKYYTLQQIKPPGSHKKRLFKEVIAVISRKLTTGQAALTKCREFTCSISLTLYNNSMRYIVVSIF